MFSFLMFGSFPASPLRTRNDRRIQLDIGLKYVKHRVSNNIKLRVK